MSVAPTLADRLRAALVEAGFPDLSVTGDDDDVVVRYGPDVPDRVVWQAFVTAGHPDVRTFHEWISA